MTTAEIATLIAQNVNDNTVGDVTPAELRAVLNALNENQQSGVYYMEDVTTAEGNTVTYTEPLIYHKIGNVVNISGGFGLSTNINQSEAIYFDLPFARDEISAAPIFAVSANNPSTRYSKLNELFVGAGLTGTGKLRLTVNTDAADSTNYLIYFSGSYVCV
jgi:hypothetical protein